MTFRNSFLPLFFPFLIALAACNETDQTVTLEQGIDELIPSAVNDTTPGLIIGVLQNGEIIFKKGYGLANLNYDIPNSPDMVYNIGSVAKQFLGYAFAMQHVAGNLNIDDPVSSYMEEWPEFDETVTIRHLLNHTSGYREAYTMSTLAGRDIGIDRMDYEEAMEVVRRQPELEFSPNSRYTYNSTAWVILAEIFEEATGVPAADWVQKNILDELEMENAQIETHVGQVIEKGAESYSFSDQRGYSNEKSNRAIFGAADVYLNVPDAMKWITNMKTAELGGEEVLNVFLEPNELSNGINTEYALGIGVNEYRGLRRYRHTGGHAAFGTQLSYYPDQDLGIFIVSNFNLAWVASERIAELILGDQMEPEITYENERIDLSEELQVILPGRYINEDRNQAIILRVEENKLLIGEDTEMIQVAKNEFHISGSTDQLEIETGFDGDESARIILTGTNGIRTFTKMESWEPVASELNEYSGEYRSDETDSIMRFSVDENGVLKVQHRWIGTVPMEPLAQDIYRTGNNMMIEFVKDQTGDITGFYANSGRTLNVWFERKQTKSID